MGSGTLAGCMITSQSTSRVVQGTLQRSCTHTQVCDVGCYCSLDLHRVEPRGWGGEGEEGLPQRVVQRDGLGASKLLKSLDGWLEGGLRVAHGCVCLDNKPSPDHGVTGATCIAGDLMIETVVFLMQGNTVVCARCSARCAPGGGAQLQTEFSCQRPSPPLNRLPACPFFIILICRLDCLLRASAKSVTNRLGDHRSNMLCIQCSTWGANTG